MTRSLSPCSYHSATRETEEPMFVYVSDMSVRVPTRSLLAVTEFTVMSGDVSVPEAVAITVSNVSARRFYARTAPVSRFLKLELFVVKFTA